MIKLNYKRVRASEVSQYSWYSDLISFDGPLLSLYKGTGYTDALYLWLDNSDRANRWCLIPVERTLLDNYLNEKVTLQEVIFKTDIVYICNHYAVTDKRHYNVLKTSDIPGEYLPEVDSYLYEEICTPDALYLRGEQTSSYMLGLDNQLFINDLSQIPKTFEQLYSFHYGLEHLGRVSVRDVMRKLMGNWTGGFSAVNIFSGLKSLIPAIHRPEVASLQYNSPGHIELNLLQDLAESVRIVSKRIESEFVFNRLERAYKTINAYLKLKGLSGFDEDSAIVVSNIPPETTLVLFKAVRILFRCFGWKEYHHKFEMIGAHPLQQLRAIMAYYRRLRILRSYIINNQLFIGESQVPS